ncbi:MAG: hypothetical protein HQL74_11655 [Magnetococcales bacterium]|nr:hypothetical protein [Magnetococcales bacterium]
MSGHEQARMLLLLVRKDLNALYEDEPFVWVEIQEQVNRDELRYILDPADVMGPDYPSETFRVLKDKEMKAFGEYRTFRLVLDAWDRLERGELPASFT